ncbi:MAG: N-acetyltransferase [Candidatus Accumulibacter sp.]|jgi:putative acetyltransferase|nr:N-acetyltransferase [Accumulibacter sp.]
MDISVRSELPGDENAIGEITRQAFESHPYSHQTEHFIVEALRKAGVLSVSQVAEHAGQLVGHIAFSPVMIEDACSDWYGMGPVSVLPKFQGKGIGRALIEQGLAKLKALGGKGCVLVGDPEFYSRFGFSNTSALTLDGVPPEVFLALSLDSSSTHGKVKFHSAFEATS